MSTLTKGNPMEAQITVAGNAGTDVSWKAIENYGSNASFTMAMTPRVRRNGLWVDGATTWFRVSVWRQLADRVRDSVKRGDPIVVSGRLSTEQWVDAQGNPREGLHIEATFVGHDLRRGTASFQRATRATSDEAPLHETDAEASLAALEAGEPDGGAAEGAEASAA